MAPTKPGDGTCEEADPPNLASVKSLLRKATRDPPSPGQSPPRRLYWWQCDCRRKQRGHPRRASRRDRLRQPGAGAGWGNRGVVWGLGGRGL